MTVMTISAPTVAPCGKPTMSGEPSGLRVSDWKIAPEMPSAPPTSSAHSTRGRRTSLMMNSEPASPPPSSVLITVPGGMSNSPVPMAKTARREHDHDQDRAEHDRPPVDAQRDRPAEPERAGGAHSWAIRFRRTSAMNSGVPTIGHHHAGLQLARPHDHPPDDVGEQQQRTAQHGRVREHPALVGAAQRARRVRHRQPEEVHRPGGRRGRAAQQRDRDRAADPRPADVRAERARRVVAQRQRVERAGQQQRDQHPEPDERQDRLQLRPAAAAERADGPEVVLLQQLLIGERDAVDDRGQRRA